MAKAAPRAKESTANIPIADSVPPVFMLFILFAEWLPKGCPGRTLLDGLCYRSKVSCLVRDLFFCSPRSPLPRNFGASLLLKSPTTDLRVSKHVLCWLLRRVGSRIQDFVVFVASKSKGRLKGVARGGLSTLRLHPTFPCMYVRGTLLHIPPHIHACVSIGQSSALPPWLVAKSFRTILHALRVRHHPKCAPKQINYCLMAKLLDPRLVGVNAEVSFR